MEPRTSIPSHHRYSTVNDDDNTYDEVIQQTTRQPLSESTGNAQPHNLAALALCHHGQLALSLPVGGVGHHQHQHHSIPTPPIVPTQALTSTYGTGYRGQPSFHRDVSLRESPMAHPRRSRNPIYSWRHFNAYRAKVMQKESENEEPKWPMYLEDAFLDAPGEVIPVGKSREKHRMFRQRKQVSSHIQVLKGFFVTHPCFHFFFPRRNDEKEEDSKNIKEDEGEAESLKKNHVLIALAEGRLPNERPNYDYFARILGADSEVFVRPKECWIYVSSSEVKLSDDCSNAFTADGTRLSADAYAPDGTLLEGKGDYPHLTLNGSKDIKKKMMGQGKDGLPNYLLHEYTRTLSQRESSSVRDISARWDLRFPDLHDKLMSALDDVQPAHDRSGRCVVGPCDTMHFDVVLDLHNTSQFPSGTHLDGVVQLNICRPELARHVWRSVTTVVKPAELDLGDAEPHYFKNECDITGKGSARDTIEVPFPATSWANTFIKLAPYVTAERERREKSGSGNGGSGKGMKIKKEEDGESCGGGVKSSAKRVMAKELLSQVAMYQEIWSASTDAPTSSSSDPQSRWTRRAVILWTFKNVHTQVDDKGKMSTTPAGTTWRFLTKVDPTSQFHQQRAYVIGSPNIPRDSIMSPNASYQHHLNAAMHETFSSAAYDTTSHHHHHHHLSGLNLLDSTTYPNGLATPLPTASLQPSYAHSFDSATVASNDSLQLHLSFLSDTSGTTTDTSQSTTTLAAAAPTTDHHHADPFLAGLGYDDQAPGWSLDGAAWSTAAVGYVDDDGAAAAAAAHGLGGWGDHTTGAGAGTATPGDVTDSHDNTPWNEGKDTLWATTTTGTSAGKSHHHHTDAWNSVVTCQPWLQGISAVADASGDGRSLSISSGAGAGWEDQLSHHHHHHHHLDDHQQQQHHHHHYHNEHGGGNHHNNTTSSSRSTSSDYTTTTVPSSLTPLMKGRKRSRGDDEDECASDGENYPLHSVRKLTHNAPTAVMEEGGGGLSHHHQQQQQSFL